MLLRCWNINQVNLMGSQLRFCVLGMPCSYRNIENRLGASQKMIHVFGKVSEQLISLAVLLDQAFC